MLTLISIAINNIPGKGLMIWCLLVLIALPSISQDQTVMRSSLEKNIEIIREDGTYLYIKNEKENKVSIQKMFLGRQKDNGQNMLLKADRIPYDSLLPAQAYLVNSAIRARKNRMFAGSGLLLVGSIFIVGGIHESGEASFLDFSGFLITMGVVSVLGGAITLGSKSMVEKKWNGILAIKPDEREPAAREMLIEIERKARRTRITGGIINGLFSIGFFLNDGSTPASYVFGGSALISLLIKSKYEREIPAVLQESNAKAAGYGLSFGLMPGGGAMATLRINLN